jgi:golgi SNAP receptor complex member 1
MATYDALHRECRTLESLLDAKLTSYARLGSSLARADDVEAEGSSERWRDVEYEVTDLLEKVHTSRSGQFPRNMTHAVGWTCS